MVKVPKGLLITFIAILVQTLIGISLGLTLLYYSSKNHTAMNIHVNGLSIGGLHREEATSKIDSKYKNIVTNDSFTIEYDNNKKFVIKYSDIDAVLNSAGTVESVFGTRYEAFVNLIKGYFSSEKRNIVPSIDFNEGKLREKLNELSVMIDKEPTNADISVKDGKVIKAHEINGVKLSMENAVQKIRNEMGSNIGGVIYFNESNGYEIETIIPQYTMYDLEGLDEIISQHSTKILNLDVEDSIILAASAINRVKLLSAEPQKGQSAGVFSFSKYISLSDGLIEKNDEGYNQVASTLYAAVLNSGIDTKAITRTPHPNTVEYIEPGLDAMVLGNTYDFKFKNTLNNPVMIFTEVQDQLLRVSIIGKKKPHESSSVLATEIIQKFTPTVEYLENQDMGAGEKRMISTGKEGIKVKVYRNTTNTNGDISKQYLYEDEYRAIKAMVEIGPNTHWGGEAVK